MTDVKDTGTIREFSSGATRDTSKDKLDFEGFMSPIVLKAYAKYLHKHRFQSDGNIRDSDNWQKMFGEKHFDVCMKSMTRHFMDVWLHHRGYSDEAVGDLEEALGGLLFNVMAYWFGVLKGKRKEAGLK